MGTNEFSKALLEWYSLNGRDLPWRHDPTPYHVLVSEFMLQQTRVDTVIPYYERFLERFPTLEELGRSEEGEVLRYWQGLGYYSRARNLRKTAQECLKTKQGCLPFEPEELSSLPGIGPYMREAIRAFAFGLPAIPIDGNLIRIYARVESQAIHPEDLKARKAAYDYFMERIESPRDFGQALMDLGELVCLPNGQPRCNACPLSFCCKAHKKSQETAYPLKKARKATPVENLSVLLLLDGQGNIAVRKRDSQGLLASMHEFPNARGGQEELSDLVPGIMLRYLGKKTHVFSHVKWNMDVYTGTGIAPDYDYMPLANLKEKAALPTAFAKLLTLLDADAR